MRKKGQTSTNRPRVRPKQNLKQQSERTRTAGHPPKDYTQTDWSDPRTDPNQTRGNSPRLTGSETKDNR
jgi:hypothetical protein